MKDWGIALWLAALMGFFLWAALNDRKRTKHLATLASNLGLKAWGDQLPSDLSLVGTPMAYRSATWNVFEGIQNGIRFIVFDCRMGTGKGSWRRTVIAARTNRDVFATVPSESSYTVDQCGEWMVFYSPKAVSFFGPFLMPIAELEARLSTLG
jgi:hypothetical protein